MKELHNKNIRHEMLNRFLEADTSLEEEQLLFTFYVHAQEEELTPEDKAVRPIILQCGYNIEGLASDATTSTPYEGIDLTDMNAKASEFNQIMKISHKLHAIRISAIFLAAAMIIGIIFHLFNHQPSKNEFFVARQTTRNITSSKETDIEKQKIIEQQDSAYLASFRQATPTKKASVHPKGRNKIVQPVTKTDKGYMSIEQIEAIDSITSILYPSSEQIKIENTEGGFVLTIIDCNGNSQLYKMETQSTPETVEYQLTALTDNRMQP